MSRVLGACPFAMLKRAGDEKGSHDMTPLPTTCMCERTLGGSKSQQQWQVPFGAV
jgi:hypothetical protein